MPLPQALSQDELNNVAFEDGLNTNGAVAADSFATWNNNDPATYTPGSDSAFKWGGGAAGTSGGTVRYYFYPGSNWTVNEVAVWKAGLALWSSIANITFQQVATAGTARLVLYRDPSTSGPAGQAAGAYTASSHGTAATGAKVLPTAGSTYVSIQTGNVGDDFNFNDTFANLFAGSAGGSGPDTVVHELGHVLGLFHAGPYNGTVDPATQLLDVAAVQQLYGGGLCGRPDLRLQLQHPGGRPPVL